MPRPLKTGLDFFQHDTSMSSDEKMEALEAVHGNDGYAVYNKLLERIYRSGGNLDLSDPVQHLSIARKCNVSPEKFNQIIADAVRFRLFDPKVWDEENRLTSDRIQVQINLVEEKREEGRDRKTGKKDSKTPENDSFPIGKPHSSGDYPAGKVHRVEESRVEESIQEECPEKESVGNGPEIGIARLLVALHQELVDPAYRVADTRVLSWAKDIEKLHRIDNREWGEIESVLRWAKADSFWSGNILSGSKFREKFPTLIAQKNRARTPQSGLKVHARAAMLDMQEA